MCSTCWVGKKYAKFWYKRERIFGKPTHKSQGDFKVCRNGIYRPMLWRYYLHSCRSPRIATNGGLLSLIFGFLKWRGIFLSSEQLSYF
jgi:hypothetical protein